MKIPLAKDRPSPYNSVVKRAKGTLFMRLKHVSIVGILSALTLTACSPNPSPESTSQPGDVSTSQTGSSSSGSTGTETPPVQGKLVLNAGEHVRLSSEGILASGFATIKIEVDPNYQVSSVDLKYSTEGAVVYDIDEGRTLIVVSIPSSHRQDTLTVTVLAGEIKPLSDASFQSVIDASKAGIKMESETRLVDLSGNAWQYKTLASFGEKEVAREYYNVAGSQVGTLYLVNDNGVATQPSLGLDNQRVLTPLTLNSNGDTATWEQTIGLVNNPLAFLASDIQRETDPSTGTSTLKLGEPSADVLKRRFQSIYVSDGQGKGHYVLKSRLDLESEEINLFYNTFITNVLLESERQLVGLNYADTPDYEITFDENGQLSSIKVSFRVRFISGTSYTFGDYSVSFSGFGKLEAEPTDPYVPLPVKDEAAAAKVKSFIDDVNGVVAGLKKGNYTLSIKSKPNSETNIGIMGDGLPNGLSSSDVFYPSSPIYVNYSEGLIATSGLNIIGSDSYGDFTYGNYVAILNNALVSGQDPSATEPVAASVFGYLPNATGEKVVVNGPFQDASALDLHNFFDVDLAAISPDFYQTGENGSYVIDFKGLGIEYGYFDTRISDALFSLFDWVYGYPSGYSGFGASGKNGYFDSLSVAFGQDSLTLGVTSTYSFSGNNFKSEVVYEFTAIGKTTGIADKPDVAEAVKAVKDYLKI